MNYRRFLLFVLTFLIISRLASAQDVISVDKLTLNQHLDHHFPLVYPPIAKAARVQGTIVFQVRIGVTGRIESMKVVSGPPMLQQAAIDCLELWTYHPFEKDGKPVAATGPVSLIFTLSDMPKSSDDHSGRPAGPSQTISVTLTREDAAGQADGELGKQLFQDDDECKKGVLAKKFDDATALICKQAAELAEQLPSDGNFIAKRSAFVYAATSLASNGDIKTALSWAVKAVDVVKLGHDNDSGSNSAYSTKGTIEGLLGDLASADKDLTAAEDYERHGVDSTVKDSLDSTEKETGERYIRGLVRDLRLHAELLKMMNRPDDAQKKLDEAAKLN